MTQPTAVVTAFLAWSLLAFPTGYSNGDNTQQAQEQVRWGAEYLMKLWQPAAAPAGAVNIIYQASTVSPIGDTLGFWLRLCSFWAAFSCLFSWLSSYQSINVYLMSWEPTGGQHTRVQFSEFIQTKSLGFCAFVALSD